MITILDVAKARGVQESEDGSINGSEFERVGLPIMGGCMCNTTVGCYNAYPSKTGYLGCEDCIGDQGFETVEEFEEFCKQDDEDEAEDDYGEDENIPSTSKGYNTIYEAHTQPNAEGKYHLHWETDDNYDQGYPSSFAEKDYYFESLELMWSFIGGLSGQGQPPTNSWYGWMAHQSVAVFIDGVLLPFKEG